ncbi:MAG: hypothetical protein H7829_16210, partial [Magnetococcus sp. THC-1_WYH]
NQKQKQNQNQNPGGNPPDPFFLLIIDYSWAFVRANFKCDCLQAFLWHGLCLSLLSLYNKRG